MSEEFNQEEWEKKGQSELFYLEQRKKYYAAFYEFISEALISSDMEIRTDSYGIRNDRIAFGLYEDARLFVEQCKESGFEVEIVEPKAGITIPKGYKCFEVRLKKFINKKDFTEEAPESNEDDLK